MSSHSARSSKFRSHQSLVRNTDHNIRVFGYCRVSTQPKDSPRARLHSSLLQKLDRCLAQLGRIRELLTGQRRTGSAC